MANTNYHITMSKDGSVAFLNKWQEGAKGDLGFLGTAVSFSPSKDRALEFSAEKAVQIIRLLRENQPNQTIRYSTVAP